MDTCLKAQCYTTVTSTCGMTLGKSSRNYDRDRLFSPKYVSSRVSGGEGSLSVSSRNGVEKY